MIPLQLRIAQAEDAETILEMQKRAFMPLYEKYRDDETSPATEGVERVRARIADPASRYWFIIWDEKAVGAIRVKASGRICRVSPMFVLPEYQGKGIAQQAMQLAEAQFPDAACWRLDTILQEKGNCHLYEKMGYVRVGEPKVINSRMTLIDYEKWMISE